MLAYRGGGDGINQVHSYLFMMKMMHILGTDFRP